MKRRLLWMMLALVGLSFVGWFVVRGEAYLGTYVIVPFVSVGLLTVGAALLFFLKPEEKSKKMQWGAMSLAALLIAGNAGAFAWMQPALTAQQAVRLLQTQSGSITVSSCTAVQSIHTDGVLATGYYKIEADTGAGRKTYYMKNNGEYTR